MAFCGSCGAENDASAKHCVSCGRSMAMAPRPGMCVECGSMNARGMDKCGNCGAPLEVVLPKEGVSEAGTGATEPSEPSAKKCVWCGNAVSGDEDVCPECQKRRGDTSLRSPLRRGKKKPSRRLTLAAVYMILSGGVGFFWGILLLFIESIVSEVRDIETGLGTCGIIIMLLGMGSLAGGVLAATRRRLILVILGSVCSFLCIALIGLTLAGFIGAIVFGLLLGLIAPLLLSGTNHEFS